jgi:L-arabinose transport system substrate-binding protein
MTVDDRLLNSSGKPLDAIVHRSISASENVGQTVAGEMNKRG